MRQLTIPPYGSRLRSDRFSGSHYRQAVHSFGQSAPSPISWPLAKSWGNRQQGSRSTMARNATIPMHSPCLKNRHASEDGERQCFFGCAPPPVCWHSLCTRSSSSGAVTEAESKPTMRRPGWRDGYLREETRTGTQDHVSSLRRPDGAGNVYGADEGLLPIARVRVALRELRGDRGPGHSPTSPTAFRGPADCPIVNPTESSGDCGSGSFSPRSPSREGQ